MLRRTAERIALDITSGPDPQSPAERRTRRRIEVLAATLRASISDRVSLCAAGCAFYATLALFPAMSMLISIYGLAFNPNSVEAQLQVMRELLPPPAFELIAERVHHLVVQPHASLGVGLGISTLVTFWSAATGTKSVLAALNIAYGEQEQRGILRFQAIGFGMTLSAMLGAVLAIAILVFMPAAIAFFGLAEYRTGLIHLGGMTILIGFTAVSIALLYRFGPSRKRGTPTRITPGAVLATLLWLIASELLTFYVDHISSFGATYGSIGAVVGVMLWFYITVYAVLLGAELNAELERQASPPQPIPPLANSPGRLLPEANGSAE
jgi:membrane protein